MKLKIKESRDKKIALAFIALSSLTALLAVGNVITGALAWHFKSTQEHIVTPMVYNKPFNANPGAGDTTALSMFAISFASLRLNVSPENIDSNHKILLRYVPSQHRDVMKKILDVEADRIKKGGISTRYDMSGLSCSQLISYMPAVKVTSGSFSLTG